MSPERITTDAGFAEMGSHFVDMPRQAWAELSASSYVGLNQASIDRLRGSGDPTNETDVQEVYLPLTQLIAQYVRNTAQLYRDSNSFLGLSAEKTPFVIAVSGSVAVGKSTVARLVKELLARSLGHPQVELVTTDGFLQPNAVLRERGILERKGFPESYDTRALLQFVVDVKSGLAEVTAPVYSHVVYDIVPSQRIVVRQPDILVLEGLNVLQPAQKTDRHGIGVMAVSDFVDFSVFVDADEDDVRRWYISRFLKLRDSAFQDPGSYFSRFAELTDDQAVTMAESIWDGVNGPNLRENIEPTKARATVILRKGPHHEIESVRIRKI